MAALFYYCCPYLPFFIDLIVLVPFWRLVTLVDVNDYLVVYMIAVNIPYTIRLVPQYIRILAPPSSPSQLPTMNDTIVETVPLGTEPIQMFFSMMSAFMVITMCYGAFNVFVCILQEIRRGKITKANIWIPVCVMMAITQGVLIAIYKFRYLSESMILFLMVYYVAICGIMAVVVAIFLRRPRPNDATWEKRRCEMKSKYNGFLIFVLIAVLPSILYTHRLAVRFMDWYFGNMEEDTIVYTFTDYMIHPWVFNLAGIMLLDPFRKVATGNMRPFSSFYRKYCTSSQTIPTIYRVPPPTYVDATKKTKKSSRPPQMY
ncbi:unnamed protein product [Haemonchus placei]|uniref:G protein-coupled receptor n=1 Tax=Haemonchus placei TaxID=6290 RepID=A0A0N4WEK4_HAEPC|nr:unnamed protein product [Haemonchus placei]